MKRLFSMSIISVILAGFISSGFGYHYPIVYMVHPTYPSCLPTIQEGVDACDPWDIVLVYPGTYYETVEINTPHIRIYAAIQGDRPVIDAGGAEKAITITGGDVTVKGMEIINAETGIFLGGSYVEGRVIDGCKIHSPGTIKRYGINVDFECHNDTIRHCDIDGYYDGIRIWDGTYNILVDSCRIYNSLEYGIYNSGQPAFDEENANHFTRCEIDGAQSGVHNRKYYADNQATFTMQNSEIRNTSEHGVSCSVREFMGANTGADAYLTGISFEKCATAGIYGYGHCSWNEGACYVYVSYSNCTFEDCGVNTLEDPHSQESNVTIEESDRAPVWAVGETYAIGDRVDYEGVIYVCIQAHTVYAPNWTPPNTPALWELE